MSWHEDSTHHPAMATEASVPVPGGGDTEPGADLAAVHGAYRRYDTIRLAHGSGGRPSLDLIRDLFAATFASAPLTALTDAAVLENRGGRLVFCTDSHAVQPLFFPGGDIGRLAVSGTVNDLAVMGAEPAYLTCALLLEEGFSMRDLERIVRSMKTAADEAGVSIVAGDTKVVERGKGDGVFINTAGVGFLPEGRVLGAGRVQRGDVLLVNGTLADHTVAIMSRRKGFEMDVPVVSDVAPLHSLIGEVLAAAPNTRFMRDLTRGGLAAVANELVLGRGFGVRIFDGRVPIDIDVAEFCEMLGIDPLLGANEGKVLVVVPAEEAEPALAAMRGHPLGRRAARIGDIVLEPRGMAIIETVYGSRRVLEMPMEEQLPRIC